MKNTLKDKKTIDKLFSKGRRIHSPILTLIYLPSENPEILISAPVKIFRKAVDRNYIKRLIRESLRVKTIGNYSLAFIYKDKEIYDFIKIDSEINAMIKLIK